MNFQKESQSIKFYIFQTQLKKKNKKMLILHYIDGYVT